MEEEEEDAEDAEGAGSAGASPASLPAQPPVARGLSFLQATAVRAADARMR